MRIQSVWVSWGQIYFARNIEFGIELPRMAIRLESPYKWIHIKLFLCYYHRIDRPGLFNMDNWELIILNVNIMRILRGRKNNG